MDRFAHPSYTIRRQVFKLFGAGFHIYDPAGQLVLYSKQKAFKLREDIRLYTGEDMQQEVLVIHTNKIIDFSASYEVIDSASQQVLGVLQRKGMKSMIRDEWAINNPAGQQIGRVQEDSGALAILRRFIGGIYSQVLAPQAFHVDIGGVHVCQMTQNRNPFVAKLTITFFDPQQLLDRRLALAAGVLLSAIEGRQQ